MIRGIYICFISDFFAYLNIKIMNVNINLLFYLYLIILYPKEIT